MSMKHTYTICPHCGCGCGLHLVRQDGLTGGVTASQGHPFSGGQLCARGWTCHQLPSAPARFVEPLLRRGASLEPASWKEAADYSARRLKAVRDRHGPEAIGILASPRLTAGELSALFRFARDVIGTPHCDSGARLTGFPVEFPRPAELADLDRADLIVVLGANLLEDNPVLGARIVSRCKPAADRPYVSPDLTHVVPGPPVRLAAAAARAGALGEIAQPHLRPRPGCEPQLVVALLKALVESHGQTSADPAFPKLRESLAKLSYSGLLDGAGVPSAQVGALAALLAGAAAPLLVAGRDLLHAPGAGTALAALADIALVMRDRLSVLPAAAAANEHAALRILPPGGGLSYPAMIGALRRRKLKALVLAGEDPLRVLPGTGEVGRALAGAEFLLSIDSFSGPVHEHCHAVLPLSLPMEKAGSFAAMDGAEQRFAAALAPAGRARPLEAALRDLAAPFRTKAGHGRPAGIPAASLDPIKGCQPPKAVAGQITLELGSVYPFLYGGDALAANTRHLAREFAGDWIELNPEDIASLGVRAGWKVMVSSEAGSLEAQLRANPAQAKGTAFMPVHFGGLALAPFSFDPALETPVLRGIPVTVGKG